MERFVAKQGDAGDVIEVQFTREVEGLEREDWPPLDLTDATEVRFHMRPAGWQEGDDGPLDAEAEFADDRETGVARYTFGEGDLDAAGVHEAEMEAAWPDGSTRTAPNDGFITVLVHEQIA